MATPTLTAVGGRRHPSPPRTAPVLGRRVVLSGALGAAAGVAFGPSMGSAGPSPAAGATLYSYGHSYTMMPSPYVSRQFFDEYQLDLGRRLEGGPVISRGRSGTALLDTISALNAAANRPAVAAFYANQGAYRALIDAVCDEYSQAVSVDLAPGWDNSTMVPVLDTRTRFHPNTLGMSCIADNFERAITTNLETSRLGLR
jgi:hypothetical protein